MDWGNGNEYWSGVVEWQVAVADLLIIELCLNAEVRASFFASFIV